MVKTQLTGIFLKSLWSALEWVYPSVCAICGQPGYPLCSTCEGEVRYIRGKICTICGNSIEGSGLICKGCNQRQPAFDALRSLAFYGGVTRECIHALKYENNRSLGKFFAQRLLPLIEREDWDIDLVLAVPLSRERLKERGYNQAAAIARPLAVYLERPFNAYGIIQARDTQSQVGLSAEERRRNVIGAFQAIPELVSDKNILLVDDVMTTGATLESCAKALRNAGCRMVYCMTIARFSRKIHT